MTSDRSGAHIVAFVIAMLAVVTGRIAMAGVPGGTPISNVATAMFQSNSGQIFASTSNTVSTVVAQIGAISVSPKQVAPALTTDGFPVGSNIVRVFTISNVSNITDAYSITKVDVGAAKIVSMNIGSVNGPPISVGSGTTSSVQSGGSIQIFITISTTGLTPGTIVPVDFTARTTVTTTVNGLQSDSGKLFGITSNPPKISGSDGGLTVLKTVQQSVSASAAIGSVVTYGISFKNTGGSTSINTVVTDIIPKGMDYVVGSAQINGVDANAKVSINANKITIIVGSVSPDTLISVTFDAKVSSFVKNGSTILNFAAVSADSIETKKTSPASLLIGVSNVVYDGYDGEKHPVPGSVVTVLDPKTGLPIPLTRQRSLSIQSISSNRDSAIGVNPTNANPFTTGSDGVYKFVFAPNQIGTGSAPAIYNISIVSPGYINRLMSITISPGTAPPLYNIHLLALDNQPLAIEGSFLLSPTIDALTDTYGLVGNQPLFKPSPISITKTVDRANLSAGDRAVFTLEYGTPDVAFAATTLTDTLPRGLAYGKGSAIVDGVHLEPEVNGRTLIWKFPDLKGKHSIIYVAIVVPGAEEGTTLVNIVDVITSSPNTGGVFTGHASASVLIIPGIMSERIVITGRVYIDKNDMGHFLRGDSGVSGVRVFLENGEYAVTDTQGRYSFPGVRPGMHAIRIDPSTFPVGTTSFDRSFYGDRSAEKLVHGIMDTTLMQDINFGLRLQNK